MARQQKVSWGGSLSPLRKSVTVVRDDTPKVSRNPEKPDVVDEPPYPIPSDWDLEIYRGDGDNIVQAWSYGGVRYITVNFDVEGSPPSNNINYTYIYDENDPEDVQSGKFGSLFD